MWKSRDVAWVDVTTLPTWKFCGVRVMISCPSEQRLLGCEGDNAGPWEDMQGLGEICRALREIMQGLAGYSALILFG